MRNVLHILLNLEPSVMPYFTQLVIDEVSKVNTQVGQIERTTFDKSFASSTWQISDYPTVVSASNFGDEKCKRASLETLSWTSLLANLSSSSGNII